MEENNSLIDILSEAMFSTVEANNRATEELFQKLEEIGISEDGSSLETVECVVKGKDDKEYVLKIPKLILMPMPLLHVKEATFDIEGEWEINENNEEKNAYIDEVKAELRLSDTEAQSLSNLSSTAIRQRIINDKSIKTGTKRRLLSAQRSPLRLRASSVKSSNEAEPSKADISANASGDKSATKSQNQNMKIKATIKMEQSDMPAGLSNLIQTVTNCIEVKREE